MDTPDGCRICTVFDLDGVARCGQKLGDGIRSDILHCRNVYHVSLQLTLPLGKTRYGQERTATS